MRVAILTGSGLYAAKLEEYVEAHPETGVTVVWTVTEPGGVLAALDHNPSVFLLDMRWRQQALEGAKLLQEAGVPLIICLYERSDDPLIPRARAMGLEVFAGPGSWGSLFSRFQVTG